MLRISASPTGVQGDICSVSMVGCVHCAPQLPSDKEGSRAAVLERCLFVPPTPRWWKVSSLAQPDKMPNCSWGLRAAVCFLWLAGWSFKSQIPTWKLPKPYYIKGLIYLFLPSMGPCLLWNNSYFFGRVCSFFPPRLPRCHMLQLIWTVQTALQLKEHQMSLMLCSQVVVLNQLERVQHWPMGSHSLQLPATFFP